MSAELKSDKQKLVKCWKSRELLHLLRHSSPVKLLANFFFVFAVQKCLDMGIRVAGLYDPSLLFNGDHNFTWHLLYHKDTTHTTRVEALAVSYGSLLVDSCSTLHNRQLAPRCVQSKMLHTAYIIWIQKAILLTQQCSWCDLSADKVQVGNEGRNSYFSKGIIYFT